MKPEKVVCSLCTGLIPTPKCRGIITCALQILVKPTYIPYICIVLYHPSACGDTLYYITSRFQYFKINRRIESTDPCLGGPPLMGIPGGGSLLLQQSLYMCDTPSTTHTSVSQSLILLYNLHLILGERQPRHQDVHLKSLSVLSPSVSLQHTYTSAKPFSDVGLEILHR